MHYMRVRTTGRLDVESPRHPRAGLCRVDDCGKAVKAKGWCGPHYRNWTLRRDPLAAGPGAGKQFGREAAGTLNGQGYRVMRVIRSDGRPHHVGQHRLVMEQMIGRELLPVETVHHKNGVRDDNRPENLELWSSHQPRGQRIEDKVAWAREILDLYGDLIDRMNASTKELV